MAKNVQSKNIVCIRRRVSERIYTTQGTNQPLWCFRVLPAVVLVILLLHESSGLLFPEHFATATFNEEPGPPPDAPDVVKTKRKWLQSVSVSVDIEIKEGRKE
jgi:hypothetical protein